MKLRSEYKKLSIFILALCIQIFLTFCFNREFKELGEMWEVFAAIMSIFTLIYAIYVWGMFKFKILSPAFLFFIATYTLHLSLIILVGFNLREYKVIANVVLYTYSEQDCVYAILYCNWFLFMYISSYMILKRNRLKENEYKKYGVDLNFTRKIGFIILGISAPAMLYNNLIQIKTRMTISYHDIYNIDTSFYGIPLGPLINLFLPSLFFILYSYNNNKKKFTYTSIVIIVYYTLYMLLTGAKINALVTIIVIMVMYNYYFGIKLSLKMILLAYIGAKVLVSVSAMRSDSGLGTTNVIQEFMNGFVKNDPIIELLNELGGTVLTPTLVMLAVRSGGGYLYGQSYLFGPIGSILQGLRVTDYFSDKANMVKYLTDPERGYYINSKTYAMGGSVIGEWYLNFGWLGIILVPLLVICIIKFEKIIFESTDNALNKVMSYCFLISLIMYSRQYITDLFWIAFYRYASCYLIIKFISKYTKSTCYKETSKCNH